MAVSTIDPAGLNIGQIGGNRNILYNGAHTVAQRATQVTGVTSTGFYTTDRWEYNTTGEETVTLEQSTDAPDGFSNSYKVTVTTADSSVASSDYARIVQELEGQDCQRLAFGTSSAKTTTLSFWVKSSVTGDYAVLFQNTDAARMLTKTYTINSANTWEYKTLTFVGDTSGSITSDNTSGLRVFFWITAGSNFTSTDNGDVWTANTSTAYAYGHTADVIGTLNATWQFTGVQLEDSPSGEPTPFEHEDYGTTLQKCKRFFERLNFLSTDYVLQGQTGGGTTTANGLFYYTEKRTAPTVTLPTAGQSSGTITFLTPTGGYPSSTGSHIIQVAGPKQCRVYGSGYSGLTAGRNSILFSTGANSVDVDAEL